MSLRPLRDGLQLRSSTQRRDAAVTIGGDLSRLRVEKSVYDRRYGDRRVIGNSGRSSRFGDAARGGDTDLVGTADLAGAASRRDSSSTCLRCRERSESVVVSSEVVELRRDWAGVLSTELCRGVEGVLGESGGGVLDGSSLEASLRT